MVRALDSERGGRGFDSQPFCFQVIIIINQQSLAYSPLCAAVSPPSK